MENYDGKTLDEFDLYYKQELTFSLLSFILINKYYFIALLIVLLLFIRIITIKIRRKRRLKRRRKY